MRKALVVNFRIRKVEPAIACSLPRRRAQSRPLIFFPTPRPVSRTLAKVVVAGILGICVEGGLLDVRVCFFGRQEAALRGRGRGPAVIEPFCGRGAWVVDLGSEDESEGGEEGEEWEVHDFVVG